MTHANGSGATLERSISTPLLVLYGVGTMLGAGIYALIGEVARTAGVLAPLAFLVASALAALTGASYAEFASRHPKSAGEAVYISAGFSSPYLSRLVGLLIVLSGVVSSGVMLRGFVGYADPFFAAPDLVVILVLAAVLGGLAVWGIGESLTAVALITLVEASALLVVIGLGLATEPVAQPVFVSPGHGPVAGVLTASVLAFYAFIGFEDMVNIAEEVRQPRRALPIGIFTALAITSAIYWAISWIAVRTTPIDDLAESDAPMALVFSHVSDWPPQAIGLVAMFAVANGALVQIVMASRVLYGLSNQDLLPRWLGAVNKTTRTPIRATVLIMALILTTSAFPLGLLAKATSFLLLTVFALVNIALIRVKRKREDSYDGYSAPDFAPWLGAVSAATFAAYSLFVMVAP
ncbi:MAG: amino acid permease [Pseudomonadota bacterium]